MDPLTIALAIYGGYQGYSSAKKAHANTLGTLFATAAGAYGGYNLGSGVNGLLEAGTEAATAGGVNAATAAGVEGGIGALYNPTAIDPYAGTSLGMDTNAALSGIGPQAVQPTGIQSIATQPQFQQLQPTIMNAGYEQPIQQGVPTLSDTGEMTYENQWRPGPNGTAQVVPAAYNQPAGIKTVNPYAGIDDRGQLGEAVNYYQGKQPTNVYTGIDDRGQLGEAVNYYQGKQPTTFGEQAWDFTKKTFTDPKTGGLDIGKTALVGIPTALYASGAFEKEPYQRNMFTYNVNYPDLYRNRKFYTQDPKTGEVKEQPQQDYIPEEKAREGMRPDQQFGPYRRETLTLREGGLASLSHFREGGVTYLPSKVQNDETNEDSYMRANGYVEDPTGAGDKNEDTMLAQLADGEFVTRTDGVLGAGILAGANPGDEKQMRKMGADFFYEQQKRFKRIFDLLDASRKATAH